MVRIASRSGEAVQADGRLDGRAFTAQSVTRPVMPMTADGPARAMDAPIGKAPPAIQFPNALTPRDGARSGRPGEQRPGMPPDRPLERMQIPPRPDTAMPERPMPARPDPPVRR